MLEQLRDMALTMSARSKLREQHPDEPWLWREDWAARVIKDNPGSAWVGCTWAFGCLWLAFTSPVALVFLMGGIKEGVQWLVLLLPLVGVAILGTALYATMRRRKFGVSLCHIDRLPVALGQTFRGHIEARVPDIPAEGFRLQLVSVRRVVRHTSKGDRSTENVLWESQTVVDRGSATKTATGVRIPFAMPIPQHVDPVRMADRNDQILWRLVVRGELPGIDYGAAFDLPVFSTGEAPSFASQAVPQPVEGSGVTIEQGVEGEEIVVEGRRGPGRFFTALSFPLFWFAVLFWMYRRGMQQNLMLIFAGLGILVLLFTLEIAVGRTIIRANRRELLVRRTWLGIGRTRTIDATQIESVATQLGATAGGRGYYEVFAMLRGGRSVRLAKHISQKVNAESIAARVRRQVGL